MSVGQPTAGDFRRQYFHLSRHGNKSPHCESHLTLWRHPMGIIRVFFVEGSGWEVHTLHFRWEITSSLSSWISHKKQLQMDVPAVLVIYIKYEGICTFIFLLSRFFFFGGLISQQTKRPCNFPRLIRWHDILVSIGASRPYVASEADVVVDTPFVAPTLRPPRSAAGRPWGNTGRKPESAALHRWSGLYVLYVAGGGFLKGILKGASNRCFFFQTFLFLVMLKGDMYCGKACNY